MLPRFRFLPSLVAVATLCTAGAPAEACSILTMRDEQKVLMGNNEDWVEPGYIWFVRGRGDRLGRVNVGFKNHFAQGSMNEKGLSFDAAVVPEIPWQKDPAKKSPKNLLEKIMNECATVEEAIAYFKKYNCPYLSKSQFLFADATGDSAVIAWHPQSGLSVERIEGRHLIATNTRLEGTGYRCARHTRAGRVLEAAEEVSVDAVAQSLESVHQRGAGAFTSYSTIYDLKAKKVHIFNLAHFGEVVTFDLTEELAGLKKKEKTYELATLFEQSPAVADLYQGPQRQDFGTRVELAPEILEKYTGYYAPTLAPEKRVRILRDGQYLVVVNPEQPESRLFAESEVHFRIAPDRGSVTFELAPDGSVQGLTLHKQIDAYARKVEGP